MIIVLNGPLGVGKTETASSLVRRLRPAALVDIDHVATVEPFDHQKEQDQEYAYETAVMLGGHHLANGYDHVVVSWVFETSAQLARLRARLARLGPVSAFLLMCSIEELESRIRRRGRADVQNELARGRELLTILEAAAKGGDVGTLIETDGRSADEAAQWILNLIRPARDSGAAAPASD